MKAQHVHMRAAMAGLERDDCMKMRRAVVLFGLVGLLIASNARAQAVQYPFLCDASAINCRTDVLNLIAAEHVGIDVSFWFMDDARYASALVKQFQAGVPVRVIMDPRANASKPANAQILNTLQSAGIPMRKKSTGDIAHWKGMIFAGQNIAEFSGANYSPYEYLPQEPYINYEDEVIYFSNELDVVHSLMRRFDDVWISTNGYADYANVVDPPVRSYPLYSIAPEFNFPPDDSYFNRLHPLLQAEGQAANGKIDVTMYRITDSREADDLIAAAANGVPVRLYAEPNEYRNPARLDDSYNIDRMFVGGVQIRMRAHDGLNHQKTVQLYSQAMTIFGTSNWSTASDDNQLEVNYFTTKTWFFQFFEDLFNRKWDNSHVMPDGTTAVESGPFTPLPPDRPVNSSPASQATGVATTGVSLKWQAGFWARQYDIYFGTTPTPPLFKANQNLGPSQSASDLKAFALPTLLPGTTYYWQIVSKTMANLSRSGPIWSFTTAGTAAPPGTPASPNPASGATNVGLNPNMTWTSAGASSFDVNLGTSNPPARVSTGQAAPSYAPPALAANTQYFWQIIAHNAAGSTSGPVWSFTTGSTSGGGGLPAPWADGDIGAVGPKGSASFSNGTFSVTGSGADIWDSADAFHYAYQTLSGDGQIVARVATIQNVASWTKAGVMIRASLNANSAMANMLISAAKGSAFQYRTSTGAAAIGPAASTKSAPYWVKITRSGSTITGFQSVDGNTWDTIGTATITLGSSAFVGLSVSSHDNTRLATATFDHVTVSGGGTLPSTPGTPSPATGATDVTTSPTLSWSSAGATSYDVKFGTANPPPQVTTGQSAASYAPATLAATTTYFWQIVAHNSAGAATGPVWSFTTGSGSGSTLPPGWTDADIGAVGKPGSASFSNGTFSVTGSGADIWGTADAFHFAWKPLTGDGQLIARVASVQNVSTWSKGGVMIRNSSAANAAYAFMLVSAAKGTAFQYRTANGASALNIGGGATLTAPYWVKIVRSGSTISAFQSTDGTTWQPVGSATFSMGASVEIGLAVTSHNNAATSTVTFDQVQ
jgi:regulation of enolase protein 1 (concanavalin A-like superfamily)